MSDDFDWGDDPFGGDIGFDDDFDSSGKKGFLRSLATGFLGGLVENSVGSTDARIKSLQSVMPKTYEGAFSNIAKLNAKKREVLEEIKEGSADTVEDLQYFAKKAASKIGDGTSNRISSGLIEFSKNDFSHWGSSSSSSNKEEGMEEVEDSELESLLKSSEANSALERENATKIGERTIGMMSQVGGRSIASINSLNSSVLRGNSLLEQLVDHQRRVKSKQDALQLSVLARTYLTNVKFFKFMEKSNHRVISELKTIGKFGKMSDFEKSSTSSKVKETLRNSVLSTVQRKASGAMGFLTNKFGKDARERAISGLGSMTSSLRMGLEMSEGMPVNYGDMLGGMASQMFIDNLPKMIQSGKGKELLKKFENKYPDQSKRFRELYAQAEDMGNVVTGVTGNLEELTNSAAYHYQGGSFFGDDEELSYEDYIAQLPKGQRKPSRVEYKAIQKAMSMTKGGVEKLLDNISLGRGKTYSMKARTLADSYEETLWTKRDSRTLTEEIPRWLSEIHLSMEKLRTGDDNLRAASYDYTKAKFISHSEKTKHVLDTVLGGTSFDRKASQANDMVSGIDKDNALSPKAKHELAFQLAKQADMGMGFNPYNLVKLEKDGVNAGVATEIRNVIMGQFGITQDHLDRFESGDDVNRALMMGKLPTKEGRERIVSLSESAKSLREVDTDVSRDLDILKANGFADALHDSGVIEFDRNGRETINYNLLDDTLKGFIRDEKYSVSGSKRAPVRNLRNRRDVQLGERTGAVEETIEDVNYESSEIAESLSNLAPTLTNFSESIRGLSLEGLDITPLTTETKELSNKVGQLIELGTVRNSTLIDLLSRQPKLSTSSDNTKSEEYDQKKADEQKKGIIDRLKESSFKDMFNSGVGKLLDNEPMMLGGLLGGLAGVAAFNPKAAGLIAGGAAVAMAYGKVKELSRARNPNDTEDLYQEGSETPILEAWKLNNGDYYDMVSNKIIKSWNMITGSIRDISTGVVIGAKALSAKLFTKENKEVVISGLDKTREFLTKTFNRLDPLGRLSKLSSRVSARFYQMDVYLEGEEDPILKGVGFKQGQYLKRSSNGEISIITGWNEIDGPVYDKDGNVLITQEDYDRGLKTSLGVSVNKLGDYSKQAGSMASSLLGKLKNKTVKAAGDIKTAVKADYSPVVNSVDRIYNLLLDRWGLDKEKYGIPNNELSQEDGSISPSFTNPRGIDKDKLKTKKLRRNSIEDKKRQEAEEKDEQVKDAIINFGNSFSEDEEDDGTGKKKRKGIFGMLAGGLGSIKTLLGGALGFMTGPMFGALKLLGKFSLMGMKLLPMMARGIFAMAKFGGKMGGGLLDMLGGRKGGRMRGLGKLGLGAAVGLAGYGLTKSGMIEEDGLASKGLDYTSMGLTAYGAAQFVAPAATAALGSSVTAGGAAAWGVMGPLLLNPITLGAVAVVGVGYGVYKFMNRGAGKQIEIRLAQYGIRDKDSNLAKKVFQLETMLMDYVNINNGRASFDRSAPLSDAIRSMLYEPENQQLLQNVFAWFNGRFKPVFLTYMATISTMKVGSMKEFDSSRSQIIYEASKQTQETIATIVPLPTEINPDIDQDEALMGVAPTNQRVKELLKELQAYINRQASPKDKRKVDLIAIPEDSSERMSELENELDSKEDGFWNRKGNVFSSRGRRARELNKLKEEEALLNSIYKVGTVAGDQDISDIYKPGDTLDHLTAIRLAAYGNHLNIAWRIEAVLKLERYCETLIKKGPSGIKFTGEIGTVFSKFKAAFRVDQGKEDNWCIWFRDRFLPVLLHYYAVVSGMANGRLSDAARTLNKSSQYLVGTVLLQVTNTETGLSVWDVGEDPFGGAPFKNPKFKAKDLLRDLEREAEVAKLRDPSSEKRMTAVNKEDLNKATGTKSKPKKNSAQSEIDKQVELDKATNEQAKEVEELFGVEKYESLGYAKVTDDEGNIFYELKSDNGKGGTNTKRIDLESIRMEEEHAMDERRRKEAEKRARQRKVEQLRSSTSSADVGGSSSLGSNQTQSPSYSNGSNAGGYSGGSVPGSRGIPDTPDLGNITSVGGDISGELDTTGVVKNKGDDRGVKTPKELAEKIIIREMLAQGFTDPREIAMVLAQTRLESGNYTATVENMNYTKPRALYKLFREVRSLDQAKRLSAAGPVAIANTVYGGGKGRQLGNFRPGDGWALRGRGWMQTTGGHNYKATGDRIGVDLLNNPQLLSEDPKVMAKSAVDFFKHNRMMRSIAQGKPFSYAGKGINPSGPPEMGRREQYYNEYLSKLTKGELNADPEGFSKEVEEDDGQGDVDNYFTSGAGSTPTPSSGSDPTSAITAKGAPERPPVRDIGYTPPKSSNTGSNNSSSESGSTTQVAQSTPVSTPAPSTQVSTPVSTPVANEPPPVLPENSNKVLEENLGKMTEGISQALASSGSDQTALLRAMVQQLAQLNENMAKEPETVRLG